MNIKLDFTWEDFLAECKEKELIAFGASSCADVFLNKLNVSFKVKYLVDNDKNKQGGKFAEKYMICAPDVLKDEENDSVLIITSTYYNEILKQLEELGFKGEVWSFLHLREKATSIEDIEEMNRNKSKLLELLSDEKSLDIVEKIMKKRENNISDYRDICEPKQYFLEDIFEDIREDEVFVDGGAYNGETVEQFVEFVGNKFKKVYSFEMDKANFDKIDRSKFDDRVEFLNYGLWDKSEEITFIVNERSSEIAEVGGETAKCIAIDECVEGEVTFIKMDIEGAEMKALEGAKNAIKNYKPKLAICLYHKFNDLWEIPFYIHSLVPEYKMYIRHHGKNDQETVLYAVAP